MFQLTAKIRKEEKLKTFFFAKKSMPYTGLLIMPGMQSGTVFDLFNKGRLKE